MGWGIKLRASQWDELDRLRFSTKSKAVFRNCLILLLSDSRDSIKSIMERVGCGRDTVVRVRRLYRKGGVQALQPAKPKGRTSRATPAYIEAMDIAARANPRDLGYGFATWSTVRLSMHLAKRTGIRFSEDQLCRLLRRHGFSVQRPKHTLKGKRDEIQYRRARSQLAVLKKSP
mgnify:CR=1 FL=1